jgi:hypothetical protein
MKKGDLLLAALLAGLILWWLFGPHVTATVTVPQKEIAVRWKGPLESAPSEVPPPLGGQDAVNLQSWLEDI